MASLEALALGIAQFYVLAVVFADAGARLAKGKGSTSSTDEIRLLVDVARRAAHRAHQLWEGGESEGLREWERWGKGGR